ncbi:MAG: ferritin-like domain-containing protein [Polyangiales bacterium]
MTCADLSLLFRDILHAAASATARCDAGASSARRDGAPLCMGGRAPRGYAYDASGEEGVDPGAWLAALASLERASVAAFETLAAQLEAHGAPARLVADARTAADDERRHAARVEGLAARYECAPRDAVATSAPPPTLEALAAENAVEGCVRETYGALVAHWQTRAADDAEVRAVMRDIADEETAHATLSWELAAWFDSRLDGDARRRVREGRDRAVEALARDARGACSERCERALGLPSPRVATALFEGLRREVWRH